MTASIEAMKRMLTIMRWSDIKGDAQSIHESLMQIDANVPDEEHRQHERIVACVDEIMNIAAERIAELQVQL